MNLWKYGIFDKDTGKLLISETGFETEADAEEQAYSDAKVANLKNYYVKTLQEWVDD